MFLCPQALEALSQWLQLRPPCRHDYLWALHKGRRIGEAAMKRLMEDYTAARQQYDKRLAIKRELGDLWGVALLLNNLGELLRLEGDYHGARCLRSVWRFGARLKPLRGSP